VGEVEKVVKVVAWQNTLFFVFKQETVKISNPTGGEAVEIGA